MVVYELVLLLVVGKIELWSTCGFLVIYAVFVIIVITTNKSEGGQNEELQDVSRKASIFIENVKHLGSVAGSAGVNNKWENTRGLLRMNNRRKIDFDDVDEVDSSSKRVGRNKAKHLGNDLNASEDREISGSINEVVNEKLEIEVMNEFPHTIG